MGNSDVVKELLSVKNDFYISDIIESSFDNSIYIYIPVDRVSKKVRKGYVSEKQINYLINKIAKKFDRKLEFYLQQSEKFEKLSEGIELILKAQFNNIEDISITFFSAEKANVWLKFKDLNNEEQSSIEEYVKSLFLRSGISEVGIQWEGEILQYPTMIQILILTKKLQPASIEDFISDFKQNFQSIDSKWLNNELDKLIKRGFVVRDHSAKKYSISGNGLSVIPSPRNNSNSDIKRALSLGKRKW